MKLVNDNIWCCPVCSYYIDECEYFSAGENYDCPKCGEVQLSEYNKGKIYE